MLCSFPRRSILSLLTVLAAFVIYLYLRPVPLVAPIDQIPVIPKTQAITLPWPSGGQAAIGATDYGVLATHNTASEVPIASIAKVITALAVLQQKPIAKGSAGATITLDQTDVDFFNNYYLKDGSVEPVKVGEQITEVQALETMLIPSANNMADSLARWAFGSVHVYVNYANNMVKQMGLSHTVVRDASGFGDDTMSTAADLVRLGIAAINNPAIASAVKQSTAQVPVAGTISNLNFLLGQDGVFGIKTGNTDKAGGCYLFAAQRQIAGHTIKLVGAILNQPDLIKAIQSADPLIKASDAGFEQLTILHKDQTMSNYHAPWGPIVSSQATKDLSLFVWKGQDIKILNKAEPVSAPAASGSHAGTVTVQTGSQKASSPLILTQSVPGPSWHWRLVRR